MEEIDKLCKPVLRWVGGKRGIINEIVKYTPKTYNTYYEPFLGGGAVLFHLQPKVAIVNDINYELINLYSIIRDDVDGLILDLKEHIIDINYYKSIRSLDRLPDYHGAVSNLKRASRMIYLNKTCFNGLYRVNSRGEFNVPFSVARTGKIIDEGRLRAVSRYLNNNDVLFQNQDFYESMCSACNNDFIYIDPPYDVDSRCDNPSFTSYTARGWCGIDLTILRGLCDKLSTRGVKFLMSNSATDRVISEFKGYNIVHIKAGRSINPKANRSCDEVLIMNYQGGI
jgi:DNA adenine methylase